MESLEIRPRVQDDDPQIVEIFHAINHDRPRYTVEEYRHEVTTMPAESGYRTCVACRNARVVGMVEWYRRWYTKEEGAHACNVRVLPKLWGQGIGSALYDLALRDIETREARLVYTSVREDLPNALRFAANRGFERTGYGNKRSRLTVAAARLDRSREAARRVTESGIRIVSVTELNPDDRMLRAMCDTDNASAATTPSSGEWNPTPFDQWRELVLGSPTYEPDAFFVALDGDRPVGLSFLEVRPDRSAHNGYTGVHPDYQGRGIARALKLRTVEWAQANGVEHINTGNDPNNKPMLAINQDLGYEPLPAVLELVKRL